MAFYFRKFSQSLRLVPATKSLGYSTRLNEGDKNKVEHDQACIKGHPCAGGDGESMQESQSSSALAPLTVRDVALVLHPRHEGNNRHQIDNLEFFSSVAKSVSFTCDDILVDLSNLPTQDSSSDPTLERVVVKVHHSDGNMNTLKNYSHPTCTPLQWEVGESCFFSSEACGDSATAFENLLTTSEKQFPPTSVLFSSSSAKKEKPSSKDKPSAEQLHSVKTQLEESVVQMFTNRYNYSVLHKNVVFENNLYGDNSVSRGQTAYGLELLKLRFKIHMAFSSATMEVLNTTVQEDTGVIRIHWRLKGLPQSEVFKFWRIFQERDEISKDDWKWFEAFSYFHIGKDGLVHKHRIDRMLPGNEEPDKLSNKLRKLLNPAKPLVN